MNCTMMTSSCRRSIRSAQWSGSAGTIRDRLSEARFLTGTGGVDVRDREKVLRKIFVFGCSIARCSALRRESCGEYAATADHRRIMFSSSYR